MYQLIVDRLPAVRELVAYAMHQEGDDTPAYDGPEYTSYRPLLSRLSHWLNCELELETFRQPLDLDDNTQEYVSEAAQAIFQHPELTRRQPVAIWCVIIDNSGQTGIIIDVGDNERR